MLDVILERNIRLVDYECIVGRYAAMVVACPTEHPTALLPTALLSTALLPTALLPTATFLPARLARLFPPDIPNPSDGKRLIGFGRYAGVAGMIDLLRGLGDRLLGLGKRPFAHCNKLATSAVHYHCQTRCQQGLVAACLV